MKRMKLQQQKNGQFLVTVPATAAQLKGWQKGQALFWVEAKEGLLLTSEEK